jgi:hypothetical protein
MTARLPIITDAQRKRGQPARRPPNSPARANVAPIQVSSVAMLAR